MAWCWQDCQDDGHDDIQKPGWWPGWRPKKGAWAGRGFWARPPMYPYASVTHPYAPICIHAVHEAQHTDLHDCWFVDNYYWFWIKYCCFDQGRDLSIGWRLEMDCSTLIYHICYNTSSIAKHISHMNYCMSPTSSCEPNNIVPQKNPSLQTHTRVQIWEDDLFPSSPVVFIP